MFDPIYAFMNEDHFMNFSAAVWFVMVILLFTSYFARNSIKFVRDEKFVKPLGKLFSHDAETQWIIIAAFTLFGWIVVAVIAAIINWLWFPCVVIAGIIAMLFMARGVVRLKKSLEEHKKDKGAHQ